MNEGNNRSRIIHLPCIFVIQLKELAHINLLTVVGF